MRDVLSQYSDGSDGDVLSQHSEAVATFLDQSSASLSQQLKKSCPQVKAWKPSKRAKAMRHLITNKNIFKLREFFKPFAPT